VKKALKLIALPFMLVFRLAWAILAGLFTFLWELVKLPFTLARSSKPSVDGHDYEYRVAEYLRRRGYHGVSVTQASGDYGADVIAKKGTKKYAVQCTYYSSPVGVAAVQEVTAAKAHYGCNAAMVVTNNTFTAAAEKLAAENGVVLLPGVTGMRVKKNKPVKQKSAAPIRAAQKVEAAPAPAHTVSAAALKPYLPLDLGVYVDQYAQTLAGMTKLSAAEVQRSCVCSFSTASQIMDRLKLYGLAAEKQTSIYEWTDKAYSLGAEGVNG
jgi:hypothetical protein